MDFEVIEIIDDSNPFPALLRINWAFDNLAVINLKKKQMTFEGHNIRIIVPLDPSKGPRYTKPIQQEEELQEADDIYNMTTTKDGYIDPTADGTLSWCYAYSYTSDSYKGMENWQNWMHEVSGRQCAQLTKSLRWIGSEVSQIPSFSGLSPVTKFLVEYKIQVPSF